MVGTRRSEPDGWNQMVGTKGSEPKGRNQRVGTRGLEPEGRNKRLKPNDQNQRVRTKGSKSSIWKQRVRTVVEDDTMTLMAFGAKTSDKTWASMQPEKKKTLESEDCKRPIVLEEENPQT